MFQKLIKPFSSIWIRTQFTNASALYVTRDRATNVNAFITPNLDFNFEDLKQSVQRRKLLIDMPEIQNIWDLYKEVENSKSLLETKKDDITQKLKKLLKENKVKQDTKEITALKLHGKLVRDNIKVIKERICELEKTAVLNVLNLPNVLDPTTPDTDIVYFQYGDKPAFKAKFHLENFENLIEYFNPQFYYLLNEAAELELRLMDESAKIFSKLEFIQFSNADFVRSIVVEGCGRNYNNQEVYTINNKEDDVMNNLHLTGGSSIMPFMAHHTKNLIFSSLLPLKYFNIGRNFTPSTGEPNGLFNVSQSTNFDVFIATANCPNENHKQFQSTVQIATNFYEKLGYHFRIVYKSADSLRKWESFRADIEMFSTSTQKYIQVGYISMSDVYYSKRLMFNYLEGKQKFFPKIIYGNVINFPRLLGCILEQKAMNNRDIISSLSFS